MGRRHATAPNVLLLTGGFKGSMQHFTEKEKWMQKEQKEQKEQKRKRRAYTAAASARERAAVRLRR